MEISAALTAKGGGSGGKVIYSNIMIDSSKTYNIVVGDGGDSDTAGGNSQFDNIIAIGGVSEHGKEQRCRRKRSECYCSSKLRKGKNHKAKEQDDRCVDHARPYFFDAFTHCHRHKKVVAE